MSQVNQNVQLLRYTPAPEETVSMAARLCYSSSTIDEIAQGVQKKDQAKYLERLIEMGHLSCIEHASFTFGIEGVSRSLLAQLTRHRLASFSVQSQRYVGKVSHDGETFDYIIPPSIQKKKNEDVKRFQDQMSQMQEWYNQWVDALGGEGEHSFEDARFVLPNAAGTRIIMTMNARELHHFFSMRCCNRAQWEIRAMAWTMLEQVNRAAPHLFVGVGPGCLRGSCPEGKKSCGQAEAIRMRYQEMLKRIEADNHA